MFPANSKSCQICKMMKHIEKPGIVGAVNWAFSGMFKDIQQYSTMFRYIEGH